MEKPPCSVGHETPWPWEENILVEQAGWSKMVHRDGSVEVTGVSSRVSSLLEPWADPCSLMTLRAMSWNGGKACWKEMGSWSGVSRNGGKTTGRRAT